MHNLDAMFAHMYVLSPRLQLSFIPKFVVGVLGFYTKIVQWNLILVHSNKLLPKFQVIKLLEGVHHTKINTNHNTSFSCELTNKI
jgi:hypothetical protein